VDMEQPPPMTSLPGMSNIVRLQFEHFAIIPRSSEPAYCSDAQTAKKGNDEAPKSDWRATDLIYPMCVRKLLCSALYTSYLLHKTQIRY